MRENDPEFDEIFQKNLRHHKIGVQTDDYVWCMRRNFTPDKWNEDYRFWESCDFSAFFHGF